jgi:hypothetical protein
VTTVVSGGSGTHTNTSRLPHLWVNTPAHVDVRAVARCDDDDTASVRFVACTMARS